MFEFRLPDVGEGVAEGELLAWQVAPGDEVAEDAVLAEVETDKAVVDLPSPVAGTVAELHAEEGEVVPVGEVLVTIDPADEADANVAGDERQEGDAGVESDAGLVGDAGVERDAGLDGDAGVDPDAAGESGATAAESHAAGADDEGPKPAIRRRSDADAEGATGEAADGESRTGDNDAAVAEPAASEGEPTDGPAAGRVFAPPHVRRLAREQGVDVRAIAGSGPGGRITATDVHDAAGTSGADDEDVAHAITEVAPEADVGEGGEAGVDTAAAAADRDRTLAAPATRRLADELDVDLDAVPTEKTRDGESFVEPGDVRAYAEAQQAAQAADAAALSEVGRSERASEPVGSDRRETREPYRGVRRSIGEQMEESAFTAPHVTHHDRAVVDALVDARAAMAPRAEDRGIRLTYVPFVLKAVVAGLQDYPVLNTSLDEENEEVVYKHHYDVGVATATDAGLMVPVVRDVDEKEIARLASEVEELTRKARERSIAREEMQGGTFTITNFGAIGGEYATPIVNYPETAILGLGAIEQRPVVDDGEVVAKHTLPLSLSIDHRVVDGAEAARFVNTVIEYLETPSLLLLE